MLPEYSHFCILPLSHSLSHSLLFNIRVRLLIQKSDTATKMEYSLFVDRETGESLDELVQDVSSLRIPEVAVSDAETGETEINNISTEQLKRRVPFQIPKEMKDELSSNKEKKKKNSTLKDVIPLTAGTCFGQMNPIFLFLPAIIYFRWFAASLMLFEVIFHGWTHHKNKILKDSDVYYRSPFYGITAEFCALCQDETRMVKVGKMQQIRLDKFLQHCNYMKRAVT